MSDILITGVAGFIGSHLAERLLSDGHRVVGVDNFDPYYDPARKRANLAVAMERSIFELREGDIREREFLREVFADRPFDAVVHLAARVGVRASVEEPVLCAEVNITGTLNILDACVKAGVRKIIFGSSSSVYGNADKVPFAENARVDRPVSPYAATKRAGELLCHTYAHLYGLRATCLRFFTVYGPRQRPEMAIHKFTRLLLDNRPIPIYGDGSASRDFTYIDDIIDGVKAALDRELSSDSKDGVAAAAEVINLGSSAPIALSELVEMLEEITGRKAKTEYHAALKEDVTRTYADIDRARDMLGYSPRVSLSDGLRRFVKWYRSTSLA